jgi:hypothetical protein
MLMLQSSFSRQNDSSPQTMYAALWLLWIMAQQAERPWMNPVSDTFGPICTAEHRGKLEAILLVLLGQADLHHDRLKPSRHGRY